MSNALLVTIVHVKMKLGHNALSNDETSDKKVMNCSPYFTALQYINNLKTKRTYKRKVNLKNVKFFKKSIEQFKNYSLIC